jgi:anti-sigma factor RsiW
MMDRNQEFKRSNAFVDDELNREERSEVLAEAARDPRLARELAALNKLKSVVEDSVHVPVLDISAVSEKPRPRRHVVWALAACLILMVAGGIAWHMLPVTPSHGVPVAWAINAHGSWSGEHAKPDLTPRARPANAPLNAHVPDLTAAKLFIAHIGDRKNPDGQPALIVGYRGTRGCRVTLLIDPAPRDLGKQAVHFEVGKVRATVWRAGTLRHLILAEGMAPQRFKMIAETVRRTSLERLPVDKETRTALAHSRATSPPCAA